ncbi:unnamed protein product [Heterobilharzia americana]|nr:unnamed protein product [Heterobilharzia americana]
MDFSTKDAVDCTTRIVNQMLKFSSRSDYGSYEFKELTELFTESYFAVQCPQHLADEYRLYIATNVLSRENCSQGIAKMFVDLGTKALQSTEIGHISVDDQFISLLASLQSALCNYLELSISLAESMSSQKTYMDEISRLLSFCSNLVERELKREVAFLVEVIIKSLYNFVCHESTVVLSVFRTMNLVDNVKHFIVSENKNVQVASHMFLAHTYKQEDQKEKTIEFFVNTLVPKIKSHSERFCGFKCEEILKGLRLLISSDGDSDFLSFDKILPHFKTIVVYFEGKTLEEALLVLWTLSFNPNLRRKIRNEFKDVVKDLQMAVELKTSEYAVSLLKALHGLLWQLNEDENLSVSSKVNSCATVEHVMLSYSHRDKNVAVDLIKHLKQKHYKVWFDVDDMKNTDNILDGMAEAVEKAYVVCILFSENYQRSPFTKREIGYAIKLGKPLIFLRAQPNYKPDGWLGLIIGTDVYIDISGKYSFEEYFVDLCQRIDKYSPNQE